jgi:ubiquinone/menaquinone biosynthesis C-methylase UbiE
MMCAADQPSPVAALFDQIADEYDAVGVEFFKPVAEGLVKEVAARPGERVLDVGCGRGAAMIPLARAVGATGAVTGIDVSARMVELAGAEAARAGVDVQVRVDDAMAPSLPTDAFDAVASSLVLFFLPDPGAALRAWRALLVSGGRVGVSTFGPYSQRWRDQVDAALAAFAPAVVAEPRTSGTQGAFSSDAGMERLLADAGFGEVRTVTTTVSPRFVDVDQWFRWSMSVGQRRFWESVPEHQLSDMKAAVFAAVERCRDEAGRIGFDQQVRYTLGVR